MASITGSSSNIVGGWACLVLQDWDQRVTHEKLPQGLAPPLKVRRGEQAWVFNRIGDYGWVPLRVLQRGEQRAKPLPIELLTPTRLMQAGVSDPGPSENTLQETLRCLWRTIKSNRSIITEIVPGMSEASKKVLFHEFAARYADIIYSSILPQARTIMSGGSFTPSQLRTLTPVSGSWPKQPGVYLIIYGDFGTRKIGSRVYEAAAYIGQTNNFQTRLSQHQARAQLESSSNHYRLAARATQKRMVPLILQNTNQVPTRFLDIAEFSMVCLFRSWYPGLFSPSDANAVGAYAADFDAALVFSRLMDQVSSKTGWGTSPTYGLNWNTPILRNAKMDQQWTGWYQEAKSMFYFRSRRQLHKSKDEYFLRWYASEAVRIPKELWNEAGFQDGQTVHVLVELRKRGDEYLTHPFRYIRLPPTVGRNPELEKLRSLAIKIQWFCESTKKWKQSYLERTKIWSTMSKTNDILQAYRRGLMLLCDVEETSYSGCPDWVFPRCPAKVQFLRYNHLEQKFVVEITQPRVLAWRQFPDTVVGAHPGPGFFTGKAKQRGNCDVCISQRSTTKCDHSSADNSCRCCRALHRPCTWSRGAQNVEDFLQEEALEELGIPLNPTRHAGAQIQVMSNPPFNPEVEAEEHGSLEE
ncbi:uncharacterized protein NECHADRAFT_75962 [Fusarium vanettenii 77-13-4]|uniref:GIY-YIG domain-containing protein n=1 Tax=Fusarium vanettenii (strain ATCC MYA-4622 / CBS 123669 / FGSC 9596 / NRRL 45880 / 77-13-4) TaxID=660122 RepID=C7Z635_FUSV7|nr:uncharacterized protein NECHADRAFT_75962 [Fusarium vanettenii 77-13-4]EEU40060.1 hypothetical protein NECHADRAFT_75962 [Fusarium vanettenii 77-13-4]